MAWIVPRKFKSGTFYYIRYSLGGKQGWLSAGRSRSSAAKIKAKIEAEIAEGRFLERRQDSNWTLERLGEVYLERLKPLKPKSYRWRSERLLQLCNILGGATLIESINLATLDRYVHKRLAKGKAISTINGEIAVLRHALSLAFRWQAETGLTEYRLKAWEPLRGQPKRRPVFLAADQVKRLLEASAARGGQADLFLRVFLATGARPGEILKLQPADVRDGALWFETLKGGADRLAPVPAELATELRDALPFEGHGEAKNRFRRHWRSVREKAKLPPVRLYDLRHTAISEMVRRGVPLRTVQRIVGHRSYRTTEGYAHFAPDQDLPEPLSW